MGAAIELGEYRQILNPHTGLWSGYCHRCRWRTANEIFDDLHEYVMPGGKECERYGVEVYWCSHSFTHEGSMREPPVTEIVPPHQVCVYRTDGNESPIINVGWLFEKDRFAPQQDRFGYFPLAAIKVFCGDEEAAGIVGDELGDIVEDAIAYGTAPDSITDSVWSAVCGHTPPRAWKHIRVQLDVAQEMHNA